MIEIVPLHGLGEMPHGGDVGQFLAGPLADVAPQASDVLVVTQKIVSKGEGRFVSLSDVTPSAAASELAAQTGKDPRLVELVLTESTEVVRAARGVLITRHRLGLVMANAGIDRSNSGDVHDDGVLLLPVDPDASAERLSSGLRSILGVAPAIVISDSFGRPWRLGVVNVAVGSHGLPSLIDRRGELDRDGRPLEMTQIAFADLLASAAGLAMGEAAEGVPAALIRGCNWPATFTPASALVRAREEDLFR